MQESEVKQFIDSKRDGGLEPQVCELFHRAMELIGRRWTGAVIQAMLDGALRFSEIRSAIRGISDRLLAERLRELEEEGVLRREVGEGRPPQVFYALTDKGRDLKTALDAVAVWARTWTSAAVSLPE